MFFDEKFIRNAAYFEAIARNYKMRFERHSNVNVRSIFLNIRNGSQLGQFWMIRKYLMILKNPIKNKYLSSTSHEVLFNIINFFFRKTWAFDSSIAALFENIVTKLCFSNTRCESLILDRGCNVIDFSMTE